MENLTHENITRVVVVRLQSAVDKLFRGKICCGAESDEGTTETTESRLQWEVTVDSSTDMLHDD
jgi:hypothetical protein